MKRANNQSAHRANVWPATDPCAIQKQTKINRLCLNFIAFSQSFDLMLMLLEFGGGVSYLRHRLRLAALKGLLLRFAQQSRQEAVKDEDQRCILTSDPYILTSPAI